MTEEKRLDVGDQIIVCRGVEKWYDDFQALRGITISIGIGEVVVICGPSGSGKSTFIRTINRLEEHQKGDIIVDGIELTNDVRNIAAIRSEIGMVFQSFNLFPHLTVLQNITLAPMRVRKLPKDKADENAHALLERVGIPEQALKFPGQLSGGQQQRVAIARAMANDPPILVADEPTGSLDSVTSEAVIDVFEELANQGTTVVLVTHDKDVARRGSRIIALTDGEIMADHNQEVPHA